MSRNTKYVKACAKCGAIDNEIHIPPCAGEAELVKITRAEHHKARRKAWRAWIKTEP